MRKNAERLLLSALVLLLMAYGCATKRYVGPTSGTAADVQASTARAIDRAVSHLPTKPFCGKRIKIKVCALTPKFGNESPEEAYIKSSLAAKLEKEGARVVEKDEDIYLMVRVRAVGAVRTRRDLPPLLYVEAISALADMNIRAIKRGELTAVMDTNIRGKSRTLETYLFYILGPIYHRQ